VNVRNWVMKYGDSSLSLTDFGSLPSISDSSKQMDIDEQENSSNVSYKANYPYHASQEDMKSGLKTGKYYKGVLRVKANDRNDCYVILSNFVGKDRKSVTIRGISL
jgi:hypothetical protein